VVYALHAIMSDWVKDRTLQAKVLAAVARVARIERGCLQQLLKADACRLVVQSMDRHKEDRSVQVRRPPVPLPAAACEVTSAYCDPRAGAWY
jgi:hypothetical protein